MASAHTRSGTRGRPPPKRCVFLCSLRHGSISAQSSSVNPKRPPVLAMRLAWGRVRFFFLVGGVFEAVFMLLYRSSPNILPGFPDRHLIASLRAPPDDLSDSAALKGAPLG